MSEVPQATKNDERVEAAQDAAQQWWDEFCIDTGDHPDFVWREKHNGHWLTFADFHQADAAPMFAAALAAADRVVPLPDQDARQILGEVTNAAMALPFDHPVRVVLTAAAMKGLESESERTFDDEHDGSVLRAGVVPLPDAPAAKLADALRPFAHNARNAGLLGSHLDPNEGNDDFGPAERAAVCRYLSLLYNGGIAARAALREYDAASGEAAQEATT